MSTQIKSGTFLGCSSGNVKIVWFWLFGRCYDSLVLVTGEMSRLYGFGYSGDVKVV